MSKAAYYRRLAKDCLELAQQMSLEADRTRLSEMAAAYAELAARAGQEESGGNDEGQND